MRFHICHCVTPSVRSYPLGLKKGDVTRVKSLVNINKNIGEKSTFMNRQVPVTHGEQVSFGKIRFAGSCSGKGENIWVDRLAGLMRGGYSRAYYSTLHLGLGGPSESQHKCTSKLREKCDKLLRWK